MEDEDLEAAAHDMFQTAILQYRGTDPIQRPAVPRQKPPIRLAGIVIFCQFI